MISSVADALQYISLLSPFRLCPSPRKKRTRKKRAKQQKDAIAQILINSRMSAEGHRPICQDTGIVTCFVNIGMDVRWETDQTVQQMVDEGVRRLQQTQITHCVIVL
ncbi:fumarate hydratase [Vibrio lentus]|nr:fumarate hydratase [Vibrio lentus]